MLLKNTGAFFMQLKKLVQKGFEGCINIAFPKLCLHCKKPCREHFFCSDCLDLLELLEPGVMLKPCGVFFVAAFEKFGIVDTILSEIRRPSIPVFSKIAASYMVYQYFRQKGFMPDIIVPFPEKGFGVKHNERLAKEVAKMMQRPIKRLFCKIRTPVLSSVSFFSKTCLSAKTVLFIVDKIDNDGINLVLRELKKISFKKVGILSFCQQTIK